MVYFTGSMLGYLAVAKTNGGSSGSGDNSVVYSIRCPVGFPAASIEVGAPVGLARTYAEFRLHFVYFSGGCKTCFSYEIYVCTIFGLLYFSLGHSPTPE